MQRKPTAVFIVVAVVLLVQVAALLSGQVRGATSLDRHSEHRHVATTLGIGTAATWQHPSSTSARPIRNHGLSTARRVLRPAPHGSNLGDAGMSSARKQGAVMLSLEASQGEEEEEEEEEEEDHDNGDVDDETTAQQQNSEKQEIAMFKVDTAGVEEAGHRALLISGLQQRFIYRDSNTNYSGFDVFVRRSHLHAVCVATLTLLCLIYMFR
jgi:hypothetical protein